MGEPVAAGSLTPQIIQRRGIAADFRRQKFQSDRLVQPLILRQPDFPHAAAAQWLDQSEAAAPDSLARLQCARHPWNCSLSLAKPPGREKRKSALVCANVRD